MLAPPVRPLIEILPEQVEYISKVDGKIDEQEQTQINQLKWLKDKIMSPDYNTKSKITLPGTSARYWLTDKNLNNLAVAKTLKLPILLVQGGRDYNVTMKEYNMWLEGMKGNSNFKPVLLDELDHQFFTGSGLANPKDVVKPNHASEKAIKSVVDFINN